jgi:hypothetical protein
MKKEPTKRQLAEIFLFGLSCLSFGIWFIWLPIICWPLLFFGAILILLFIVTIATMVLKKVLK